MQKQIKKIVFLKWKYVKNLEIMHFHDSDDNPIPLDENGDVDYDQYESGELWWQISDIELAINGWPKVFLGVMDGVDDADILKKAHERFDFPVEAMELGEI